MLHRNVRWSRACPFKHLYHVRIKYAYEDGIKEKLGLKRQVLPVKNCRNISKADMVYNNVCGDIRVDPETYTVTVDGEVITCEPFDELALAQRYFMF